MSREEESGAMGWAPRKMRDVKLSYVVLNNIIL